MGYIDDTISVTNSRLDLGGFPHMTKQEFFQSQVLMFTPMGYVDFLPEVQCPRPVQHRHTNVNIKVFGVTEPRQVHEVPPLRSPPTNITFMTPITCSQRANNSFWKV